MDIPTKITPCPITEALVELRFDSSLPDDAVFGVIYNEFRTEFSEVEKLPILQVPEVIRSKDQNLKYKPYYRLVKGDYIIQIGPKVFSLANIREYVGWGTFSDKIAKTFAVLSGLDIINTIVRFGLRYINLFADTNIYEKSMLKIQLGERNLYKNSNNLTMIIPTGNFQSKLVMVNRASVKLQREQKTVEGSLIDIDVWSERNINFENIEETVKNAHEEEKKLFFSLLNSNFLETMNPEY